MSQQSQDFICKQLLKRIQKLNMSWRHLFFVYDRESKQTYDVLSLEQSHMFNKWEHTPHIKSLFQKRIFYKWGHVLSYRYFTKELLDHLKQRVSEVVQNEEKYQKMTEDERKMYDGEGKHRGDHFQEWESAKQFMNFIELAQVAIKLGMLVYYFEI